ncbi:MAG: hypothetical protein NTW05_17025 [Pseudonocardiales bacterium]|nr:hypothetical protein [Pseudonocardiales bacterium]
MRPLVLGRGATAADLAGPAAAEGAAGPARLELLRPDDARRGLLRVRLDGEWVGDLLLPSAGDRDRVLDALRSGAVDVVTGPVPAPDFAGFDTPTPAV